MGAACGARVIRAVAFARVLFTMNPNNYYRCLNLCAQQDLCRVFSYQRDAGGNTCVLFENDNTSGSGDPLYDVAYDPLSVRGYKLDDSCQGDDIPVPGGAAASCNAPQCTIFGEDRCDACTSF
jgi:hypothetical protein